MCNARTFGLPVRDGRNHPPVGFFFLAWPGRDTRMVLGSLPGIHSKFGGMGQTCT